MSILFELLPHALQPELANRIVHHLSVQLPVFLRTLQHSVFLHRRLQTLKHVLLAGLQVFDPRVGLVQRLLIILHLLLIVFLGHNFFEVLVHLSRLQSLLFLRPQCFGLLVVLD